MTRNGVLALAVFVAGTAGCAFWAYRRVAEIAPYLSGSSGGIGAVSAGLGELVVELAAVILPLVITFRLAKAAGSRLARAWRNAHLLATPVLIAVALVGSSFPRALVVWAIFMPVQVFFANGALAIWIAGPRA